MSGGKRLARVVTLAAAGFAALADGLPAAAIAPAGRYTIEGDEVFDTKTGLTWQRVALGRVAPDAAAILCEEGWRVPTVKELQTLVDDTSTPAIDRGAFPDGAPEAYWSSTRKVGTPGAFWVVDFALGGTRPESASARQRCVR